MEKKFDCTKWLLISGVIIGILLMFILYLFLSRLSHEKNLKDKIYYLEKKIENYRIEISQTRDSLEILTQQYDLQHENLKKLENELENLHDQPVPDSYLFMPADSAVREFIRRTDHY